MVTKLTGDDTGIVGDLSCDRRALLTGTCCGFLLLGMPIVPARASEGGPAGAQLSFFADRPMMDQSGKLHAYRPPRGFRGGAPVSTLDDERLRRLSPFMT